jgi:hypothetical protein
MIDDQWFSLVLVLHDMVPSVYIDMSTRDIVTSMTSQHKCDTLKVLWFTPSPTRDLRQSLRVRLFIVDHALRQRGVYPSA